MNQAPALKGQAFLVVVEKQVEIFHILDTFWRSIFCATYIMVFRNNVANGRFWQGEKRNMKSKLGCHMLRNLKKMKKQQHMGLF